MDLVNLLILSSVIYKTILLKTIWNAYTSTLKIIITDACVSDLQHLHIYSFFLNQVFQQSAVIPIGTKCAPLLADQFLYSYEADYIQTLVHGKKRSLDVAFNSKFRYSDDVFSYQSTIIISILTSTQYIPVYFKIKDTIESAVQICFIIGYYTGNGH